ncbi:unnamed protein product [Triticum turgidum subsp. durum]|uniref:Transposase (putative) gypsy type domain-containing protein n=1 Tax=Triticum turgidum subsp. durum TaxID=4567 RepID=A0A9R0ZSH1_TRITD|nr:unnamed protein product [Triticum turgidum subsp. durum]
MPSPSVNPEHGEVSTDEILAPYAAMPTRATGAEGFASFLRTHGEVDALCEKYGVPKDQYTAHPAGDLRANSTPPPGAICVYAGALEAGMRVPLQGFFREVLAHFGISPAQLTPNGWRVMEGFLVLCDSADVPPSLAVFRRFFHLSVYDRRHKKGWYFFVSRGGSSSLRFTGMPNRNSKSIVGWKHDFFFLSTPAPWHCAVDWGEPPKRSFGNPALTVEENESAVKLLGAHGGAAVDLRNLLPATCPWQRRYPCKTNLAVAASPPPPPSSSRTTSRSKGMHPSVHDMLKIMPAEKAAASASAKKRTWEEANGGEEVPPLSVLSCVHSPPPQHFPSRHNGHTTDREAARELLQGATEPPLERVFAANEPSDTMGNRAADDAAIRQDANYALELEKKLVAREREAAALRKQLEEAKNELASAKRAADAEREKAKSELAAAGTELETTKAELAAAKRTAEAERVQTKAELAASLADVVKTKGELAVTKQAVAEAVKTKAELAAAKRATETEVAKANAELAAANRAVEAELVKAKAKLATAEKELDSAKAAAAVRELLASEEKVRRRAELALEGYERWRGRHAPAGRAA